MDLRVENKVIKDLSKSSILQQTAFWSGVKRKLGIRSKAFDIKARSSDLFISSNHQTHVTDDLLVLFFNFGNDAQVAYVPYGPTLKPSEENQGVFLEELSESLRPLLPSNCIMLRYDLVWESLWTNEASCLNQNGDWLGPPSKSSQEIRLNFDTQKWNLKKANTNILPPDTIFINLEKNEARLISDMKSKTRYNIRLAERKGVRVRCADMNDLNIWYHLYEETCARNYIYCNEIDYFKAVLETHVANTKPPVQVELLIAEMDDQPLAAMFLVFSDTRAYYLYGASSSANRNSMATYALQWEAIKRAKQRGCSKYDMFGVAPGPDPSHPLYGLYRFKSGFGGRLFHRMGCWDYPLNDRKYKSYLTAEMNSQGYHIH